MKTLVLDGAGAAREEGDRVLAALGAALAGRGHEVVRRELGPLEIPPCNGDFGCWTVTPGRCVQAGPHRELLREMVRSDLVVWLTPVTFGGYSSELKRFLDHCIPAASPLMARFDGETHHPGRYARMPSLLVLGLEDRPDPDAAAVFHRLVRRNVLNLHPPRYASAIAGADDPPARWLDAALEALAASTPPRAVAAPLELGPRAGLPVVPPRRAVVLSGSPRGRASISAALASDLAARLSAHGVAAIATELHGELRRDSELRAVCAEVAAADVVALVAPLYVDSLPAPVIRSLELLAPAARLRRSPARFLAIVQCGFPEAVHTDTALGICRCFAARAELDWIGGLGMGGGGMLGPRPLAEQGGRARAVSRALELAADAVARGEVVPPEAQRLVRRLPIPAWLYRRIADVGFRRDARRHGVLAQLGARPDA